MGVKLWLPTKYTLKHEPTGRESILIIPGASGMDGAQLKEIVQWQQEKFTEESKKLGQKPKRVHSRKEVGQALKEFRDQMLKRKTSLNNKIYY